MKSNLLFACIAILLIAAPAYPKDTKPIDEILKEMADAIAGVDSWAADIEMDMNMMGMEIGATGNMTQAGKRSVTERTMKMQMPGLQAAAEGSEEINALMNDIKMKTVMDEDGIQWIEMNMMGQLQVMKVDMNKMMEASDEMLGLQGLMGGGNPFDMMGDPTKMLEMYKEFMDFELDGKETVGGVEVYVLKGNMKVGATAAEGMKALIAMAPEMDSLMNDITMKVGVEDGFMRETTMGEVDGKPIMVLRMNNVKFDVDIDESTFVYTPPEDATVMDMTEMINNQLDGLQTSGQETEEP
ncbi:MAG: hypothetical protein QGG73_04765 [Candidatus Hydrogenedentes bacterium]|jgi:hypothetical protein|nr:hypothetical protein [Candidatus Hydrogenedentota bacterium]